MQKADFFQPCQPMQVQGTLGQNIFFTGLDHLQYTAAAIAGPMLISEIKNHDFENLQSTEQLDQLAGIAVNLAKAILQRCHDEKIVAAQEAQQQKPGILKTM